MLQLKTIQKDTFELLKRLSSRSELNIFALGGGTALALQLGHRVSIDMDFLTEEKFDSFSLFESLCESFDVENSSTEVNSLALYVKQHGVSIKTDFIRHNYSKLRPLLTADGVRFFSIEDIAAMKLNAVANRGAKNE